MLLEGKNAEAEKLVYAHFNCQGLGSARARGKDAPYGAYQTLGNLRIDSPAGRNGTVTDYLRMLDLPSALATIEYQRDGVKFRRESFVSKPDEAIIVRLSADKPGKISFDARLDRPERFETVADGKSGLLMRGQLHNGTDGKGTLWAARLRVVNKGGEISVEGNILHVRNADEATLFVTAATDYRGFAGRQLTDPLKASEQDLNKAAAKSYKALLPRTSQIFNATSIGCNSRLVL